MAAAIENAIFQWEEAFERLQAMRSRPDVYRAIGESVVAVEDELRKRLGSSFSIAELASLYEGDPLWAIERARDAAPEDSRATDTALAIDAAFYLYARGLGLRRRLEARPVPLVVCLVTLTRKWRGSGGARQGRRKPG